MKRQKRNEDDGGHKNLGSNFLSHGIISGKAKEEEDVCEAVDGLGRYLSTEITKV